MRRNVCLGLILITLFILATYRTVFADSGQAYQDYLYQFDVYRQKNTEFKIAKNEYEKFKTLTSETIALEKTKLMLAQRDLLLRAYLLLLNERLNEDVGLSLTEKQLYQTLIRNEVVFLENHSQLIPSIGAITDADDVSKQLQSHYRVLEVSIRQTIIGLSLGKLAVLSREYDATVADAQNLINGNRGVFTPQKQATIDRWVLQITNKKSLYQQKVNSIMTGSALLKSSEYEDIDGQFLKLQRDIAEARQYLAEGTSFLGELISTLRYAD